MPLILSLHGMLLIFRIGKEYAEKNDTILTVVGRAKNSASRTHHSLFVYKGWSIHPTGPEKLIQCQNGLFCSTQKEFPGWTNRRIFCLKDNFKNKMPWITGLPPYRVPQENSLECNQKRTITTVSLLMNS